MLLDIIYYASQLHLSSHSRKHFSCIICGTEPTRGRNPFITRKRVLDDNKIFIYASILKQQFKIYLEERFSILYKFKIATTFFPEKITFRKNIVLQKKKNGF